MKLWKRNAVAAAIVLFVCGAVYLNWSYTQDTRTEQGESETVVINQGSSTQGTVTIQELYPSYQGALLVCPGGDDPTVRLKLTEATSALTGLGADKISISKGK